MTDIIQSEVQQQNCFVRIDTYTRQAPFSGSALNCPSADDYYGFEEIEYSILDENENEWPELEDKITAKEDEYICNQISNFFEERFMPEEY